MKIDSEEEAIFIAERKEWDDSLFVQIPSKWKGNLKAGKSGKNLVRNNTYLLFTDHGCHTSGKEHSCHSNDERLNFQVGNTEALNNTCLLYTSRCV